MVLIRSLIYFIGLMLSTIVISTLLVLTFWFLPYKTRCQMVNIWGGVNLWMQKVICGLTYEIEGFENFPASGAIVMSKHQSAWETIAFRALLVPTQTWVLKRELLFLPFFGWALATVQPIAIDRKAKKKALKQVIEQGKRRLQQGRVVIIFPEGTRVAPGVRGKYGIGGAMLAASTEFPVVPVAHNAGVFWSRQALKKYPGTIKVVVGKPIETKGRKASDINREVEEWIEARQAELPLTR